MPERVFDTGVVARWSELAEQARQEIDGHWVAVSDQFTPEANQAIDRLRVAIACMSMTCTLPNGRRRTG
jgi:hypothetical protein